MSIVYKIDVLNTLKDRGYTTYRLRKDKLLAEGSIQNLRENKAISFENLNRICEMLECQPADIIEYVKEAQ